MNLRSKTQRNRRLSSNWQRRQQHLLNVKVRAKKATQQRNRLIFTWVSRIVLAGALVACMVFGVRAGLRRFLWENPDYILSEVEITSDGSLAREQVMRTAGIREGENIFRIDISQAREALAELPQVESVEIQRILPNKIAIVMSERKPVAWITAKNNADPSTSERSFLVGRKGILIKTNKLLPEYLHLPVISGVSTDEMQAGQIVEAPEIKAALELIRKNTEGVLQPRFEAKAIDLSKGYCMVVTDSNGERITFGLDQIDSQFERLEIVLNKIDEDKRQLQTVNLMVQRNVPVTFLPPIGESAENKTPKTTAPSVASQENAAAVEKIPSKAKPVPAKKSTGSQVVRKQNAEMFLKAKATGTPMPVRKAIPAYP